MLKTIDIQRLSDHGDIVAFTYRDGFDRERTGFVIRLDDDFFAFRNRCPHWDTPLGKDVEALFDDATDELVCQTHGARFDPETGECRLGPCRGQRLEKLSVEARDQKLHIRRSTLEL